MFRLLFIGLLLSCVPLPWLASAQAESRREGEWIMPALRGVKQDGLEHRVCSLEMEEIILCFEMFWQSGLLRLWTQVTIPEESSARFRDGFASDFWIEGLVFGGTSLEPDLGSTNGMLDADRFLGADRSQYYHYGGDWLFFQMVAAPPAHYLSNTHTFYQKIIRAKHLRLVHYLEGGKTFETEYDLAGLAPLLTAAFEEAAAMEHKYGRPPAE